LFSDRQLLFSSCQKNIAWISIILISFSLCDAFQAFAENSGSIQMSRMKDVSSIEGVRDNQLIGYGIVVGLHGTGDSSQTIFPLQTLISTLERLGVTISQGSASSSLQVKNMAAAFISATLPAFAQPGTKIDITVSSAGDAASLDGGLLLMTPLYGADGQIYAQAQGALLVGGYVASSNGNSKQFNHPTMARIPSGGIVERALMFDLTKQRSFRFLLDDADFKTAELACAAINREVDGNRARVIDSRSIELTVDPSDDVPALLARVEAVEVEVYPRAKVVVNERTGTVVIGGHVRLQPVSILHGGLVVNVVSEPKVSQPNALSAGTTEVVRQTVVQAQDKPVNRIELRVGATVDDLVQKLQEIGATARDVISILQAMKEAGALEAELEVQ
jgi:flagellar P-ring protein precursor FlgI